MIRSGAPLTHTQAEKPALLGGALSDAPAQAGRGGPKANLDVIPGGWLVASAVVLGSLEFEIRIDALVFDTAHRSRSSVLARSVDRDSTRTFLAAYAFDERHC